MKVTSYEISKALHKAGFKVETDFIWSTSFSDEQKPPALFYHHHSVSRLSDSIAAYDLETILEALPTRLIRENSRNPTTQEIVLKKNSIRYGESSYLTKRSENESLADTAARLLLMILEKEKE